MSLQELLDLLRATGHWSHVREIILNGVWEGKTYGAIATTAHYDADYLKKAAFELWRVLTGLFGEPISKVHCRSIIEGRSLTR